MRDELVPFSGRKVGITGLDAHNEMRVIGLDCVFSHISRMHMQRHLLDLNLVLLES